jgi:hypothetical protein
LGSEDRHAEALAKVDCLIFDLRFSISDFHVLKMRLRASYSESKIGKRKSKIRRLCRHAGL